MRIARFRAADGQIGQGVVEQESINVIDGDVFGSWKPTGRKMRMADVTLLAPVVPVNIFCIGLNYREHAKESNCPIPKNPVVFMKPTTALNGPTSPIHVPACCDPAGEVDYECELAVVVGKQAKNVPVAKALEHVLGYCAANDVSARNWQANGGGGQWIRGKGFDTFCPLGPVMVMTDEIPDPQTLGIKTILNGQVVQNHTTADMIFSVAELVSFLSQSTTLLPGTLILTGTPQGIGGARKPPLWLKPGDEVIVELDKVGRLVNPVIAEPCI